MRQGQTILALSLAVGLVSTLPTPNLNENITFADPSIQAYYDEAQALVDEFKKDLETLAQQGDINKEMQMQIAANLDTAIDEDKAKAAITGEVEASSLEESEAEILEILDGADDELDTILDVIGQAASGPQPSASQAAAGPMATAVPASSAAPPATSSAPGASSSLKGPQKRGFSDFLSKMGSVAKDIAGKVSSAAIKYGPSIVKGVSSGISNYFEQTQGGARHVASTA